MPHKKLTPRNPAAAAAATVKVESKRAWSRDQRLALAGYASYKAYLASEAWHNARIRYWDANRHRTGCFLCDSKKPLVLHHRTYERVGEERPDDLVALCPSCHIFVHGMEAAGYVDCLDPEAVVALTDEERVKRNRIADRIRREQIEAERHPDPISKDDPRAKASGRLVNRIRKFAKLAEQAGADPNPTLESCLAEITALLDEQQRPNEFTRAKRKAA